MKEKPLFMSWQHIDLKCGYTHKNENGKVYNPPMEIMQGTVGAYYDCPDEHCPNRIPLLAYEKVMNDVQMLISEDVIQNGYTWKMRSSRQSYELTVLNYKEGEKIVIGIKNLTLRRSR